MTDRWDEEAERALESTAAATWLGESEWIECIEWVAAALRRAYEFGARCRVDSAFQELIANLDPYLDAQSMHAVHAECAKIEERLATPAPKPDAGGRCGTCDGTGIEFGGDPCRFCDGSGSAHANPAAPPSPVSQPDAGGRCAFCSGFGEVPDGPHDGTFGSMMDCPACTEPNHVSQPPAQPNGEGDALGRPETYRAGTVPEKVDPSRCGYCGHPKNSGSCQRSHP
jgi:hypothetical protein